VAQTYLANVSSQLTKYDMDFSFKLWLENEIDLKTRVVIIPKNTVLYHGTIESYDTRQIAGGGSDNIFWTASKPILARMYIPSKESSTSFSIRHLLYNQDYEKERQSLGITQAVQNKAYEIDHEAYKKLKYWDDLNKEFNRRFKEMDSAGQYEMPQKFWDDWGEAENNAIEAKKNWRSSETLLKNYAIRKLKNLGYKVEGDYVTDVVKDAEGNLLPANTKSVGKVLKVLCQRDFKFFNMALGREGDLTEPQHTMYSQFQNIENAGYDGVVINDFAQSDFMGNYGHIAYGFFEKALKDLKVSQMRNQVHPGREELGY